MLFGQGEGVLMIVKSSQLFVRLFGVVVVALAMMVSPNLVLAEVESADVDESAAEPESDSGDAVVGDDDQAQAEAQRLSFRGPVKLMVVPVQGTGSPKLRKAVVRLVTNPLREEVIVIPLSKYRRAAKRAGFILRYIGTPEALSTAGRQIRATHALVLESGRRSRRQVGRGMAKYYVDVKLLDVRVQDVLLKSRYDLQKRTITPEDAERIVNSSLDIIIDLQEQSFASARGGWARGEGAGEAEAGMDDLEYMEEDYGRGLLTRMAWTKRVRTPFHLSAGLLGFNRQAVIDTTSREQSEGSLEYDNGGFVPGLGITGEAYPFAMVTNKWWGQVFGVTFDAAMSAVTASQDGETSTSTTVGYRVGPSFRYVLWNELNAPDITVGVGYGVASFPVSVGSFPGAEYSSMYGSAKLNASLPVPIPGLDGIGFTLGMRYDLSVTPQGGLDTLGTVDSAGANSYDGGLRFSRGPIDVLLRIAVENVSAEFSGETSLDRNIQYNDVTIDDKVVSAVALVGYSFE